MRLEVRRPRCFLYLSFLPESYRYCQHGEPSHDVGDEHIVTGDMCVLGIVEIFVQEIRLPNLDSVRTLC
jgi:hypothetical protein